MSENTKSTTAAAENDGAAQEEAKAITPNYDNTVDVKEVKFHFKKDNLGNKRPTIELKLPTPSVEGLVSILETGGKSLDLLLGAAQDVIISQARSILNDEGNENLTDKDFPYEQCLWDFIANLPEAVGRGRGIAKEVWEDFEKDYTEAMPALTGKTKEAVELAAKLFKGKFQSVKTNKPVIGKLKEQLAVYLNGAPNAENFSECVKFLDAKADTLLEADETELLDNL